MFIATKEQPLAPSMFPKYQRVLFFFCGKRWDGDRRSEKSLFLASCLGIRAGFAVYTKPKEKPSGTQGNMYASLNQDAHLISHHACNFYLKKHAGHEMCRCLTKSHTYYHRVIRAKERLNQLRKRVLSGHLPPIMRRSSTNLVRARISSTFNKGSHSPQGLFSLILGIEETILNQLWWTLIIIQMG